MPFVSGVTGRMFVPSAFMMSIQVKSVVVWTPWSSTYAIVNPSGDQAG